VFHYEMAPDEHNRVMDARWRDVLTYIDDILHKHDAERKWWEENKATASLDVLRQAVREMMGQAGGASAEEPILENEVAVPDPPKEVRPLRWLLMVRAEIARRRILLGQIVLLLQEGQERGLIWAEERWPDLDHRISGAGYGDEAVKECNTEELLALVERREQAAAAFEVSGSQLAPALLDLETIGAASFL